MSQSGKMKAFVDFFKKHPPCILPWKEKAKQMEEEQTKRTEENEEERVKKENIGES